MNSNEIQKDNIKSTLIKIETLQKEYEVTLQQYQEAGKNYIATLKSDSSNPCFNYKNDSTGISQDCYNKIWSDQGCSTQAPTISDTTQTLEDLVNSSFSSATLTDTTNRQTCYGDSTTYTTNTSPIYPNVSVFTALKGRSWWGTSGLTEGPVESQADCETMCANSDQCSGATFNPVKRYCWTRSGEASITTGDDSNYALLTQQKAALYVMKNLNEQLLKLNAQINESLQTINPEVKQQYDEKNQKQQELTTSYNQLLEQKIELEKQLQEYYSVEQDENNQSLYVNQQNMSYRIWAFIALFILFITIKKMSGSEFPPDIITLIISIAILFVIVKYTLK